MAIDIPMFKGARSTGTIRWGTIAPRSQYVLILLAVTFTWLMGLMGFARSGIRQHWHVYGVLRDTSVDAVTPALGYAANVITLGDHRLLRARHVHLLAGRSGREGPGRGAHGHAPGAGPSPAAATATPSMRVPVGVKVGVVRRSSVMGVYSCYANSIPQIESKPPQELSLEGGNVTPAQLVKAGEEIYHTKGTCEICHRIGQKGTRAPDLAGIGARAAKTKPGMSAKQYIIESLHQSAGAFIVEGYPPIMPAVDKPPIALNRSELWALTAFLESLGGTVDVTLNDIPATAGAGGAAGAARGRGQAPRRSQGRRGGVPGQGHLHRVPQGGQDRRLAGGPRPLADRQDPDARLHHEEDPRSQRAWARWPASRTASCRRPSAQTPDRQGVHGSGLLPADPEMRSR